jgi:hypothetical protein
MTRHNDGEHNSEHNDGGNDHCRAYQARSRYLPVETDRGFRPGHFAGILSMRRSGSRFKRDELTYEEVGQSEVCSSR